MHISRIFETIKSLETGGKLGGTEVSRFGWGFFFLINGWTTGYLKHVLQHQACCDGGYKHIKGRNNLFTALIVNCVVVSVRA